MKSTRRLVWSETAAPAELHTALRVLGAEYPIAENGRGIRVSWQKRPDRGVRVTRTAPDAIEIAYGSTADALRGTGDALAGLETDAPGSFDSIGIMLDVSRNLVFRVEYLKKLLRRMALMGYTRLLLYAEDVYRLPGEPCFGRWRGAYSAAEIRELDNYAFSLGIEVVGCIQTLGHLWHVVKYPAYRKIRDTESILMSDLPETYQLVEKMLDFWSTNLRSRTLHVGMDEIPELGRGRYLDQFGYTDGFELYVRHLERLGELCRARGLAPMIWSDLGFRLNNPEREYYLPGSRIPEAVARRIPAGIRMVYYDYYHADAELYAGMIQSHRASGFDPVMASGIWTWGCLWYDHEKTRATVRPAVTACRTTGVREIFFTMWGDNGAYCHFDSALAGAAFAADNCYGDPDEKRTAARFRAVCGNDYGICLAGSRVNYYPGDLEHKISAALEIWDDPLLGPQFFEDSKTAPEFDRAFAAECRDALRTVTGKTGAGLNHLRRLLELCAAKLEFRRELLEAWHDRDRTRLERIAAERIPALREKLRAFDRSFRNQWLEAGKPFGLETIQARNAAVDSRLGETRRRIRDYIAGKLSSIDELEENFR